MKSIGATTVRLTHRGETVLNVVVALLVVLALAVNPW